ncbi:hypothetical protein CDAR_212951 [Caerostris darwini]|uniref:Uncharacterized protein n=1 Tax=Caerostris darwini TaxID=1538125 RepID=A0AAV4UBC5_9ARAC|nr:hypothetical protein CDAR_212951 [Caerostris darwini]
MFGTDPDSTGTLDLGKAHFAQVVLDSGSKRTPHDRRITTIFEEILSSVTVRVHNAEFPLSVWKTRNLFLLEKKRSCGGREGLTSVDKCSIRYA